MQRRQKTQRQRKYSVVWCHVVQILFYGFHSRWFTLFTNWVENWWKPSEISCPMCCKMALSKNKTMAPSFGTFLNFKIQKEISSLLLLQVLPFSLWPTPSIHLLDMNCPLRMRLIEAWWKCSRCTYRVVNIRIWVYQVTPRQYASCDRPKLLIV